MSDEQNMAVNDAPEQSITESPAVEQQAPEQSTEAQTTTAEVQETQSTEPVRSRASERINKLSGRVKDLTRELEEARGKTSQIGNQAQQQGFPPQFQYQNPFADQSEIDPNQLDSVITQRAQAMAELTVTEILGKRDAEEQHRQKINGWTSDLESVDAQIRGDFKDDPELAEEISIALADQLEELNQDFYESKGKTPPRVSASQVYKTIKKTIDTAQAKARQRTQSSLESIREESALRSSNSFEESDGYTEADIWNNPDKIINKLGKKLRG